ncbi:uncharacterized protein B0H18DRAFT_956172 [Fomitopsis serialis]|uniref:uncharacterized protein n=1 Tax=Fomitopsis serialis TaxID=139415 RepID=UPI0020087DB9|nr:uncharacterized protein B0H18DRAFT_956172 [Neoantrodia serialis]KAH9922642.1 hypothetical protein B0H18DRAFT_956172 [Neoantrodia serialis]
MRYSILAQAAIIAAVVAPALALPTEIRAFEPEDAALIERELLTDVAERADYDNLVARDDQNQDPSPAAPTPHPWVEEDPSPAVPTPRPWVEGEPSPAAPTPHPWDSALDELN